MTKRLDRQPHPASSCAFTTAEAIQTRDVDRVAKLLAALGVAARELHVEMVQLLLAYGADPQARDVDDVTPLDCLKLVGSPEDPAAQESLRENRRLVGAPSG